MLDEPTRQKLRQRIRGHELFRHPGNADCLIVFTHGLTKSPEDYEDLLVSLMSEDREPLACADLLPFKFRATLGANTDLSRQAVRLADAIQEVCARHRYERIVLVGHSIGGLLVRQAVLDGYQQVGARAGGETWVSKIDRLVLLASANRGFVIHQMYRRVALSLARMLGRSRLIRDGLRGSKWMNNLRLGWLLTFDQTGCRAPFTIQLRGEADAVVSKYDSMDLYRFANSEEVELAGVEHEHFCGMTAAHPAYEKIRDAFVVDPPATPAAPSPGAVAKRTKRLVFLVHGIRDFGEWQDSLAYEIQRRDPEATVVSVRYGYFNIFQFLLRFQRERAVRSFVDRYIQELAKHDVSLDNVEIAVAAHSNGTYVLAHALKAYPQIVVHRIYLAGSVLPRGFGWDRLSRTQLRTLSVVRNDCANWDWPVGILCSGLRPVFFRSLGIAGYRGFEAGSSEVSGPTIRDNLYLPGGHGAAFTPNHHGETADFLLSGEPQQPGRRVAPQGLMQAFHFASWFLIPAALAGLYFVYFRLIPLLPGSPLQVIASAIFTLLFILILVRI